MKKIIKFPPLFVLSFLKELHNIPAIQDRLGQMTESSTVRINKLYLYQ